MIQIKIDCDLCNHPFEVWAREDSVDRHGYQGPPTPESTTCPPCAGLGVAPPQCPSCQDAQLVGQKISSRSDSWIHACPNCDAEYPLSAVQALSLGEFAQNAIKAEIAAREQLGRTPSGSVPTAETILGRTILNAALERGIITPKDVITLYRL